MTPEKETPSLKGVEEVVAECRVYCETAVAAGGWLIYYEGIIESYLYDWLRTTLLARDAATARVLCDLLEGGKYMINNPHLSSEEEEYVHNIAIEKAQALIRQTLDPISINE